MYKYNKDHNVADLEKPPNPNSTEGGVAPSTSVKCVKKWRALVDYCDPCLAGTRMGASALKVGL